MSRRLRLPLLLTVLLSLVGLLLGAVTATAANATETNCTKFVATTGSDSAAGTLTAPWRTVLASINKLKAGDVLCLKPGTYTEEVVDSSLPAGTASAPITVESYDPGNPALIDGRTSLSNLAWWTVYDVHFTNPTPTATDIVSERILAFIGGHDVTISHNEIFNGKYAGLLVGRASPTSSTWPMNYHVLNNYIHDTTANNIYFNPGAVSSGHVISRNLLVHAGTENLKVGWGDNCDGYSGGTAGYGAGGTTVSYNTMVDGGTAGNFVIAEPGGQHPVTADHNLFEDIDSQRGFHVRYDSATNSATYPHGCLGDDATVTDSWAYGTKPGTTVQIPFSEDYDDAPQSQAREARNTLGVDPKLDVHYVPTVAAAQAYGYWAP